MKKFTLLVVLLVFSSGCVEPLPEAESPAAMLYADRCGTCHRAHNPKLLTPKMWDVQLTRMQDQIARRGMRKVSPEDRVVILDYLTRHAVKP